TGRRSSASPRTCRWCRRRGWRRSGAGASPARCSTGACARARAASPPAPGSRDRTGRLFRQLLELGPVALELLSLFLHHLGWRSPAEPLVGELAFGTGDLGPQLFAALLDPGRDRAGIDLLRGKHLYRADGSDRIPSIAPEHEARETPDELLRRFALDPCAEL